MDFFQIKEREGKKGILEVYPDFKVARSKDLMVRGGKFYAIWDEAAGLWSTDEFDVQRLVDEELRNYQVQTPGIFDVYRRFLGNFSTNSWMQFRNYVKHLSDSAHQLDENLTFSNTEVKKTDYVSQRLPYPLEAGPISAYDELISVLYSEEERRKIEWAIGSIIAGDSKTIQKFLVFYGAMGTGKSTVLNIIEKLFQGYTEAFVAKELTGANNSFAMESFKRNPLVAIEHDGNLSKIQDNSKLNSLVSHEYMQINEKNKPVYSMRFNAMLMIGSNSAVRITDAKSGLIRRLIDIHPTGKKVSPRKYQSLVSQINFELGGIAWHCLQVYREMGKDYYEGYRPVEMMLQTDVYFNFIEEYFDVFKSQNGTTLTQAYNLYKEYCAESGVEHVIPKHAFREELKNYFDKFEERAVVDNVRVRSWYSEFLSDKFTVHKKEDPVLPLVLDEVDSIFDTQFADYPAQYANSHGTPVKVWDEVTTVLSDLDTREVHYVRPGESHIVIDFDLKDEHGEKSAELNLEAASKWPATYTEFSQGGGGLHLHYNYEGEISRLSRVYSDGIEIKVFTGNASLRRRLSKCNNVPIATINSGLPLKEKKMINSDAVKSERALRELIERNLRKEIHPGTKPSMDFIHKILEDAYMSGLKYDVSDMKNKILAFANNSSNQALYCIKLVQSMRFHSEVSEELTEEKEATEKSDDPLVFFDVEVFPNLFVVCWKFAGAKNVVRMINPTAQAIEELMSLKLVGFNCRRYDNHILYGAFMGFNNEQLYKLSQKMVNNVPNSTFGEAYDISYTDIYDFSSKKQSLKKFQIELGLRHLELGLPWDKPVPEELWDKVAEYCENDVISTEATFEARKQDFIAREILSDLSGLNVNASTQQHTSKIIFGTDRRPQEKFKYTDLSKQFPGYEFEGGKSSYKGEITGEGGYVYAEPGIYTDVALLDVDSMHPTSIEALDLFGEYTKKFSELKEARIAIKRGHIDEARKMLGGKLARHLKSDDEKDAEALSYALKIVINIVYGLTAARFDNSFRDPRNIDNIVAKRGALFMVDLKHYVKELGYTVAHIKTDSIKIPNADDYIINLVMEFGVRYGYTFQHEATYEKLCLVNDAVYVAKSKPGKKPASWTAVGAQFQHPYVFKKLFTKEKINFEDLCETRSVSTALYLDFGTEEVPMIFEHDEKHFVGKTGVFVPVIPGAGGGLLVREKEGKFHSASKSSGYFWLEADTVKTLGMEDKIDMSYFDKLADEAIDTINKFGDYEWFVS